MKAVSATKVLVEDSRTVEYRTGRPSDVHIGDDLFPLEAAPPAPVSRHQELDSGVLSDVMHMDRYAGGQARKSQCLSPEALTKRRGSCAEWKNLAEAE